ncbi:MAG: hypothetical protein K2X81_25870, partial [Candidatus Obscuribacterales bacterium]|nr:hypothetical protein [Candidatus Obscuribacterales bacterium]
PVFETLPEEDFDDDLGEGEFDAEVPALAAASMPTMPSSPPQEAEEDVPVQAITALPPSPPPLAVPPSPPAQPVAVPAASDVAKRSVAHGLGEVNDQNYLTVLGKALDMIGWSDEQADQYSQASFGVSHWDELGRSQAEKLIMHLVDQLNAV